MRHSLINYIYWKYDEPLPHILEFRRTSRGSWLWNSLCDVWKKMHSNVRWCVGDGKTTGFWEDNWIPNHGPLVDVVRALIP